MSVSRSSALFYPIGLPYRELVNLAAGLHEDPALDVVQFPTAGGEIALELAVPFLAGMDEVRVDQAQLRLRSHPQKLDLADYQIHTSSGAKDVGVVVALPNPGRLLQVELKPSFPEAVLADPTNASLRVVVRPAEPGAGGFSFGPPIFAAPDFPPPGDLYDRVLTGLQSRDLVGGRLELTFPSVLGSAWLIQYARGDEPADLQAVEFSATVNRVALDAAPRNLTAVLAPAAEALPLWSHPDLFLPAAGSQLISFTPAAENHLAAELTAAAEQVPPPVTLGLPLQFRSESGGAVDVVEKTLLARYAVRPLGSRPAPSRLSGSRTPLLLSAPAGRRPDAAKGRLVARTLGRELNAGSPEPPLTPPASGLRIGVERWAAAQVEFSPPDGGTGGQPLPLASLRVYLEALADSEVALEIRSDVAGAPGPTVAATVVGQLASGYRDWLELALAPPLLAVAGGAPLWVALRLTRGEALWFGSGSGPARVSADRGQSWGAADPVLLAGGGLLVQLFHVVETPAAPSVRLAAGSSTLVENLLAGATPTGPDEFVVESLGLPSGLADRLAATSGQGRATTELSLFSRTALDLTFDDFTLLYNPTVGGG